MKQKIVGFHQDEENHWVADLECGHKQHVRHEPPFFKREWVASPEKRESQIGIELNCSRCDEVGLVVAKAIQAASIIALREAHLEVSAAAMCKEGQIEVAIACINNLDLEKISQSAIAKATGQFGTLNL